MVSTALVAPTPPAPTPAWTDRYARWPLIGTMQRRRAHAAFLANREQNLFWGEYSSWEAARSAAAACGAAGYDNAGSARLYVHRTRIDVHDYPALYWLTRSAHEGFRRIFDVGGATGIKYLAFRDALAAAPDLRWCVQDVPAMVAEGRRLAAERGAGPRLSFTDRFDDGQGHDLLFASGALQYLAQSLGDLLAGWPVDRLPRRIVINTTPLHPQTAYFTVNSIGTAFCPYRVQTQAELVRGLALLGFKPRESWANLGKTLEIPFRPDLSLSQYGGLCLDRAV
jgi:putative methyltransferase (TIGR04325 family)